MAKLSKDKRDRVILVSLVSVFAMASLYILLVKSQKEKLKQIAAETQNIEEQITGAKRLLDQREEFEKALEKVSTELSKREDGMANGDKFAWFLKLMTNFKMNYQVEIPQVSPAIVGPVSIFPEFPYEAATFKVGGSAHFYEFGKFLKDFENQHPYFRVQNLELEPDTTGSEKVNFRMDVVTLVKPANS